MARAPFQVLVFPYVERRARLFEYAIFQWSQSPGYWQGIAGGGEDAETPLEAAKRESMEEAGIPESSDFMELEAQCLIPVVDVAGFLWGKERILIPEHCFGVRLDSEADQLRLSHEHRAFQWLNLKDAQALVKWDSNRTALWELDYRLRNP